MSIPRPKPLQQIPADAEKVFSGVLYDAYHWQQKLFDGSTATFERLRREDSAVIIPVTPEGKIVIAREQQPGTDWFVTLPCGGIKAGEDPVAAAARELNEETGYTAAQFDLWFAHQVSSRIDWAIYTFIARGAVRSGLQHADPGERIETQEVTFDEFLQAASQNNFQNIDLAPRLLRAALDKTEMASLKKLFGVV